MGKRNRRLQQWLKSSRQVSSDWVEVELLRYETRPRAIGAEVLHLVLLCSLLSLCVSSTALFPCAEGG